jgi:hypothetical protein
MMKRRNIWNGSNKMQALVWHLASLMLLFIVVASCYREPLELYKQGDSKVTIQYIWSEYNGPMPEGIYVMYFMNGNDLSSGNLTHDLDGETNEQMPNGTYKQMVMTNNFTYYTDRENMSFYNTDDYEKMMAVSRTHDITDINAWDAGRRYLKEPLPIGVAIDSFEVKMNNDGLVFYEYTKDADIDTLNQERQDTILPMTTTLTIRVKVRGLNYLKSPNDGGVDGYVSGLADGFLFSQQWRRSNVGDIKLNHWRIDGYETEIPANSRRADGDNENESDNNSYKVGWIATDIQTFGLPHGRELLHQRTPQSNFLKLHFTMIDNNTIEFNYDVGKMIHYEGDDGSLDVTFEKSNVSLQLDLEIDANTVGEDEIPTIPYAQPSGTGAFDAEVEDWGDDENVDVPM